MGIILYTNKVFLVHTQNPVLGSATRQDTLGKVPIGSLAQRLGSLCNVIAKELGGVKWSTVRVTLQECRVVNTAPAWLNTQQSSFLSLCGTWLDCCSLL